FSFLLFFGYFLTSPAADGFPVRGTLSTIVFSLQKLYTHFFYFLYLIFVQKATLAKVAFITDLAKLKNTWDNNIYLKIDLIIEKIF
ncbi:MAG: hypothetical protein KKA19_00985, partial [Candidatus Margulisbacteria bacterium]|nr:hypothetical protein [Candidatus Margulisiibacteriota bacterium]